MPLILHRTVRRCSGCNYCDESVCRPMEIFVFVFNIKPNTAMILLSEQLEHCWFPVGCYIILCRLRQERQSTWLIQFLKPVETLMAVTHTQGDGGHRYNEQRLSDTFQQEKWEESGFELKGWTWLLVIAGESRLVRKRLWWRLVMLSKAFLWVHNVTALRLSVSVHVWVCVCAYP